MNQKKMEAVRAMVELFGTIWTIRGTTSDQKTEAYYTVLKKYRTEDIVRGGQRCLDKCTRFPLPAEIIEAMDLRDTESKAFEIHQGRKCAQCGYVGMVIEEPLGSFYRCRQCYSGLTKQEYEQRIKDLIIRMGNKNYEPQWMKDVHRWHGWTR